MTDNHIENPADYMSRTELLNFLLNGHAISDAFYPNVVKDIKSSTKLIRLIEGLMILIFAGAILYTIIEWASNGWPVRNFKLLVALVATTPVIYFILRNFRTELPIEKIITRSQDLRTSRKALHYFTQLRESNFDVAKSKAEGLVTIGKLHRADGGLLCLLGKKKDRHGIRKFTMGWGV